MLTVNGIKDDTTTIKNPQDNAICEQLHQTISSNLRAILDHHSPQNPPQVNDIIDTCFAAAAYAFKAAIHHTLNISPGIGFSSKHDIEYPTYHRSTTTS